ncbi:probable RNA polymerase II nuclear localization protein SLC7A6OS [Saccostrea cucullata]|uniref:probable RNA polymerase II nuclear localization protein SLC7A6OS n=1 Tax=Saccostrea cuccullata TaxID=36930 RepID=UPI002ED2AD1C
MSSTCCCHSESLLICRLSIKEKVKHNPIFKMATIVRVKRRRYEDPAENIVLSCKKLKSDVADIGQHDKDGCESYLKFAGTVISKDEVISKHIKDAIRKEKLQREYKSHQPGVLPRSRRHKKESSKANRFKITSSFRALDLAALDKEGDDCTEKEISPLKSTDTCDICRKQIAKRSKSQTGIGTEKGEHGEKEHDFCNCRQNIIVNSAEGVEKGQRNSHEASSAASGAQSTEKVYHLYDVEVNQSTRSNLPTFESLIQEAQNASLVTCNSEQMVHEQVPEEKEEDYVYDLYYTNSRDFNLQIFESSLSIHSLHTVEYDYMNGEEDHEIYEDEDDENEESNWRNDYPEEDPRFIEDEGEDIDYVYGNDVDDYQAFGYDDRGLVEWMSSRCNIEDESDESSSDETEDENPAGYGHYKQRVMRELEIDDS